MSNFNYINIGSVDSVNVPAETDVIFVSDYFDNEHSGGAELSDKALIESCTGNVFCVKSRD